MRTLKQVTMGLFTVAMLTVVFPITADAACSLTGYINSGGQCANSFMSDRYGYDRFHEERRSAIEHFRDRMRDFRSNFFGKFDHKRDRDHDKSFGDDFDVMTRHATNISDHEATMRGEVEFGDEDELSVWFVYGRSQNDLDQRTVMRDLDRDFDDEFFSIRVGGLMEDEVYFFRAVAKNEHGERERGSILSFRTDEDDTDGRAPDVTTGVVNDITNKSAELTGKVDMNDFHNGIVFFVYGEDGEQVRDIDDDHDTFNDIMEDGEDLQKVLVDTDLDTTEDYEKGITNLDGNTRIHYRLCVEFERDNGDDQLVCGQTKNFLTY